MSRVCLILLSVLETTDLLGALSQASSQRVLHSESWVDCLFLQQLVSGSCVCPHNVFVQSVSLTHCLSPDSNAGRGATEIPEAAKAEAVAVARHYVRDFFGNCRGQECLNQLSVIPSFFRGVCEPNLRILREGRQLLGAGG